MEIHPSAKKLVVVLGIAAGAGLALTFIYRGINKKGRVLSPPKTHPERTRATVSSSRKALPAHVMNAGTIRPDQQAPIPPPRAVDLPPAPDCTVKPSTHPALAVLSMTHQSDTPR